MPVTSKQIHFSSMIFCLIIVMVQINFVITQCQYLSKMEGFERATFNIIGFFPVNNEQPEMLSSSGVIYSEVIKFVIKRFNQKIGKELVGYKIFDECSPDEIDVLTKALLTLELSTPVHAEVDDCPCIYKDEHFSRIIGIVGPSYSSKCAHVNKVLSYNRLPMVSYGSTSPELSDNELYPDLYRTILPDAYQAGFFKDFLIAHNWTFISVLYSDDTYGRSGMHAMNKMKSLCIFIHRRMIFPMKDDFIKHTFEQLRENKDANVIVLWGPFNLIQFILTKAHQFGVRGKIWIVSEASGRKSWFLSPKNQLDGHLLVVAPNAGHYKEFDEYFFNISYSRNMENMWIKTFFNKHGINETHHSRKTLHNFRHFFELGNVGFVRNAVMTYLNALQNAARNMTDISQFRIRNHNQFSKKYIQTTDFKGLLGERVRFDENGDVQNGAFKLFIAQKKENRFDLIASWSTEKGLILETSPLVSNLSKLESRCSDNCSIGHYPIFNQLKRCCWKCVLCKENFFKPSRGLNSCRPCPRFHISINNRSTCKKVTKTFLRFSTLKGTLICVISSVGTCMTIATLLIFVLRRSTYIVRSSNFSLSLIQLILHILLYLLPYLFFGEDSVLKCTLRVISIGTVYLLLSSTIMAKVYLLICIFNLEHRVTISEQYQIKTKMILIAITPILIEIAGVTVIIHSYPMKVKHISVMGSAESHDVDYVCDSNVLLGTLAGYILIYQIYCCMHAFKARNLPDVYNETSHISFAMFTSILVIVTLFPLSQSFHESRDLNFVLSIGFFVANTSIFLILYAYKLTSKNFKRRRVSSYNPSLRKMKTQEVSFSSTMENKSN